MKAIICDTCGKSVPDTKEADILPLYLRYGLEPAVKVINRDICPDCVESLVLFFEPRPLDKLVHEIVAEVERQYKSEPEVTTLGPAPVPECSEKERRPVVNTFDEIFNGKTIFEESVPDTTFEVEIPKVSESLKSVQHINIGNHVSFKPAEDVREIKTVLCANCNNPFIPKTKIAKCCCKECGQQKWYKEQKLKNETPEQKKIRTDELLKKLKSENPVKRNDERPSIYREM